MICLENVKRFCDGYVRDIPGYSEAVNSPDMWDCHHTQEIQPDGTVLTKAWMVAHKIYYKVLPCQLRFMRHSDHVSLHNAHPSASGVANHKKALNSKAYKEEHSVQSKERWSSSRTKMLKSQNGVIYRTFGLTVKQVAEKLGIPMGSVHYKFKKGELDLCLLT